MMTFCAVRLWGVSSPFHAGFSVANSVSALVASDRFQSRILFCIEPGAVVENAPGGSGELVGQGVDFR